MKLTCSAKRTGVRGIAGQRIHIKDLQNPLTYGRNRCVTLSMLPSHRNSQRGNITRRNQLTQIAHQPGRIANISRNHPTATGHGFSQDIG